MPSFPKKKAARKHQLLPKSHRAEHKQNTDEEPSEQTHKQ
jgi:hypothetical protein